MNSVDFHATGGATASGLNNTEVLKKSGWSGSFKATYLCKGEDQHLIQATHRTWGDIILSKITFGLFGKGKTETKQLHIDWIKGEGDQNIDLKKLSTHIEEFYKDSKSRVKKYSEDLSKAFVTVITEKKGELDARDQEAASRTFRAFHSAPTTPSNKTLSVPSQQATQSPKKAEVDIVNIINDQKALAKLANEMVEDLTTSKLSQEQFKNQLTRLCKELSPEGTMALFRAIITNVYARKGDRAMLNRSLVRSVIASPQDGVINSLRNTDKYKPLEIAQLQQSCVAEFDRQIAQIAGSNS